MTLNLNDSKINFTNFELSNHLGNVLATVTDYKIGIDSIYTYSPGNSGTRMYKDHAFTFQSSGQYTVSLPANPFTVNAFHANIRNATDYYPFGMMIPWRYDDGDDGNFNTSLDIPMNLGEHRFGFNGMEQEDEIKGITKSIYTTEFRAYDPIICRWWSIDPKIIFFPWQSPYVAFDNNPVNKVDPKGDAAGDPEKTTKAAKNAVDKVKNEDPPGKTPSRCNIGVNYAFSELTGSDELSNKTANEMISHMETSDNWEVVDISKVQELANKGEIIIAGYKTNGSGHVALAVPGTSEKSTGTWNNKNAKTLEGGIPKLMDTGYGMRQTSQSANYSFGNAEKKGGINKQKDVVFYRYKPALETTNSNEVAQKALNTRSQN